MGYELKTFALHPMLELRRAVADLGIRLWGGGGGGGGGVGLEGRRPSPARGSPIGVWGVAPEALRASNHAINCSPQHES